MDRTTLGNTLALRIDQLRGKNAVILCLREESLMTCLTMASQLHAWIYPLVYVPAYTHDDHSRRLLGAFDQDGEFCALPDGPLAESETPSEVAALIQKQRPSALRTLHEKMASYDLTFDKHRLDGRHIILAADVITDILPLVVAQRFLRGVTPKSLTAVAGNATPEVAQMLRMSATHSEVLDILSGIVSDEGHYFEHADAYTPKQKHALTQHIATYWQ